MKSYLVIILFLVGLTEGNSQVEFGAKVGLNSSNITIKQLISNNTSSVKQFLHKPNLGYQAGLFARFKLLGLYAEPNLFYHKSKLEITNEENEGRSESYNISAYTLPIHLGLKISVLRIFAGPVVSLEKYEINNAVENYKEDLRKSNFGLQTGIGLDIKKIKVEAIYENVTFSKPIDLSEMQPENLEIIRSSRISLNLGYKF